MRHDMPTKFYKKDIAYSARRIMKLLTNAYGGEWDFEIGNDYGTKYFNVFNTTDINDYGIGEHDIPWHQMWSAGGYSFKMTARTWYELAENVQSMLMFGCLGAKAANNIGKNIEIYDLD